MFKGWTSIDTSLQVRPKQDFFFLIVQTFREDDTVATATLVMILAEHGENGSVALPIRAGSASS